MASTHTQGNNEDATQQAQPQSGEDNVEDTGQDNANEVLWGCFTLKPKKS